MNQFLLQLAQQIVQKLSLNHIVWGMVLPLVVAFILTLLIVYVMLKRSQPNPSVAARLTNKATLSLILRLENHKWKNELLFMAGVDSARFETVKSQEWDFNEEEYIRLCSILQKYDEGLISESRGKHRSWCSIAVTGVKMTPV